jgi:hypothetical protein
MSYGLSYAERFQHAADYVDKILRGTQAGDIPVEQPTKFEFVQSEDCQSAWPDYPAHTAIRRRHRDRINGSVFAALHMSLAMTVLRAGRTWGAIRRQCHRRPS